MNNQFLLIKPNDLFSRTSLMGNIDVDKIAPMMFMAQNIELRRILGNKLVDRLSAELQNNTLTGRYKEVYHLFVVDLMAYYSAKYIVQFLPYNITNGGISRHVGENEDYIENETIMKLVDSYATLGANVELEYSKWIRDNKIKEVEDSGCGKHKTNYSFNWYLDEDKRSSRRRKNDLI